MSYRLKLTIMISLLIAVSFGIGGTLMINTSFNASLEQEKQAALNSFENTQNTLYLLNTMGDQSDYDSLADALSQMEMQGIGQWQALSLKVDSQRLFYSGTAEMLGYILSTPSENQCISRHVSDKYGHGLLLKQVITSSNANFEIVARFDMTQVYMMRDMLQRQYQIVYLSVVVIGIIASVTISYTMTRRLRHLAATVREISGGDLSKRSDIQSSDEFGQLSKDFDAMANKLQDNISTMESDMQRQESFMGAFAHELKTPMTSIIGFADLLRQDSLDENTRMLAADYIYSEGRRLERLSFKLLDLILIKKDKITMKRVRLRSYLAEIERALTPIVNNKNIQLICNASEGYVALEPDLVKSLLYNLVDNAYKAMDDCGMIAVQASVITGGCQIQVADNGRGMKPDELTKITDAFYRIDKARSRNQGGAGLGLALCKQIVALHNGSIHFFSEPGKGTRVTVTLYGKAEQNDADS